MKGNKFVSWRINENVRNAHEMLSSWIPRISRRNFCRYILKSLPSCLFPAGRNMSGLVGVFCGRGLVGRSETLPPTGSVGTKNSACHTYRWSSLVIRALRWQRTLWICSTLMASLWTIAPPFPSCLVEICFVVFA